MAPKRKAKQLDGPRHTKTPKLSQRREQETIPFFTKLPQEMRDEIYHQVFSNTRVAWGRRPADRNLAVRFKPAPNALALLRTCRRIRDEIGDTWLGKVLFHFEELEEMLDKLTPLPVQIVSKLRHIRVSGKALTLHSFPFNYNLSLASALKLIPSLRLDTLTVFGSLAGRVVAQYESLNKLIRGSSGWKELRYICRFSTILGYAEGSIIWSVPSDNLLRRPQPSDWQSALNDRDGDSQPSVAIYRSKTVTNYMDPIDSLMINPSNWERYEQPIPGTKEDDLKFGLAADAKITTGDEEHKEVLIIVRRGKAVGYETKITTAPLPAASGETVNQLDLTGKSWNQIRAAHIDTRPSEIYHYPFDSDSDGEEECVEVADSYENVNEYSWAPLDSIHWGNHDAIVM